LVLVNRPDLKPYISNHFLSKALVKFFDQLRLQELKLLHPWGTRNIDQEQLSFNCFRSGIFSNCRPHHVLPLLPEPMGIQINIHSRGLYGLLQDYSEGSGFVHLLSHTLPLVCRTAVCQHKLFPFSLTMRGRVAMFPF